MNTKNILVVEDDADISSLLRFSLETAGFSIFEIVRHEKGQLKPFAQVRRQIRDILRLTEERQRFQSYINDLRNRYSDQIQIDQARLVATLPDDFLATF